VGKREKEREACKSLLMTSKLEDRPPISVPGLPKERRKGGGDVILHAANIPCAPEQEGANAQRRRRKKEKEEEKGTHGASPMPLMF